MQLITLLTISYGQKVFKHSLRRRRGAIAGGIRKRAGDPAEKREKPAKNLPKAPEKTLQTKGKNVK